MERTNTISIHEAKSSLSKLVKRAAAGETIYIGAYGKPEVVLIAVPPERQLAELRKGALGYMKDKMILHEGIGEYYSIQGAEDFEERGGANMTAVQAVYDGKVFIPEEPCDISSGSKVTFTIEAVNNSNSEKQNRLTAFRKLTGELNEINKTDPLPREFDDILSHRVNFRDFDNL